MTGPGGKRRRWVVAMVAAWILGLTGLSWWSIRNDPATVPEQRDLGQAVPALRKATGTLLAAADGPWAIRLDALRTEKCRLTPVRDGLDAKRDLVLYVGEGQTRAALDRVAGGLPDGFKAGVTPSRAGSRLSFFADAGDFIAIEGEAGAADQILTLTLDTGCRPGPATLGADPAAGAAPAVFGKTVAALGGTAGAPASVQAAACPEGGTAVTLAGAGGASGDRPRGIPEGTTPLWSGPDGWAYRDGAASVVVDATGQNLTVSVTTGCGGQ
ncbi:MULTISPECIES: hypothetical protein [unclassified Actinoplanes]|uniref:hypothetical protein n=1 Tax=unclassified Actinoplanes TaxID=2626549 RepID=UPI001E42F7C9|nr:MULTISPECIES: hypothetical protein [unclassified Actinoplanes]